MYGFQTTTINHGHIEPPKVVRVHAMYMYVDGKILNTEFNFYWNKHVIYRQAHMCDHLQTCNDLHPVHSVCLLATELEIKDFLGMEIHASC